MKLKNWILKKKIALIVLAIGAVAGFLYWNFVGCASGNCGITANWHTSMAYGALMGWLVGDFASEKFNTSKTKQEDQN
tara:strand:- start:1174 stop:1407 length:234 start_codon:yes stop_codon:yes gene_type:complete